ncbi:hypothetical protein BASA50_002648 [Batrachochytrium salamandrivorans]|uniref:RRM domain-containing protein n=1 Tax=Batrachochytrium salamandrivorans TaxID=1357716 RepID=A0ABQ8FKR4_9FUNG|nr:hypothetical protein BASA50_002648 [Batrachochytrium salamandrivorans]
MACTGEELRRSHSDADRVKTEPHSLCRRKVSVFPSSLYQTHTHRSIVADLIMSSNTTAVPVAAAPVEDPEAMMDDNVDEEIEAMKKRVKEMEEEAAKLKEMQAEVEKEMGAQSAGDKEEVDSRSVYIGNVDYSSTPEEIQVHFQSCGTINRVTILCDKWTGHPKGFAYLEFADTASVDNAVVLNESMFKGRLIKVTSKRTNQHGFNFRGRRAGRGFRGGFRGRAPYR